MRSDTFGITPIFLQFTIFTFSSIFCFYFWKYCDRILDIVVENAVLTIIIVSCICLIAALAYYIYEESNGFKVTEYTLQSSLINKDSIRIAFLSDLHNYEHGEKNKDLYDAIEKGNPDFIIFAGDMITSCMEADYDYSKTLEFIEALSKKWTIYYGMGNHEERFRRKSDKFPGKYEDLTNKLTKIGAPIIVDEKIEVNDFGIAIYGLDLEHDYYRKLIKRKLPDDYLNNKFGDVDKTKFSILIAHNPEHFKEYAKWGENLCLSGHVHGGIVNIPLLGGVISPQLKIFPKYDGGLFHEGDSTMILSRGIGSHTTNIRVNNKAELIFINIKR